MEKIESIIEDLEHLIKLVKVIKYPIDETYLFQTIGYIQGSLNINICELKTFMIINKWNSSKEKLPIQYESVYIFFENWLKVEIGYYDNKNWIFKNKRSFTQGNCYWKKIEIPNFE